MLRNTMTEKSLTLSSLVGGRATSNSFFVKIPSNDIVADLNELIKIKRAPEFDVVVTDKLSLCIFSNPVHVHKDKTTF